MTIDPGTTSPYTGSDNPLESLVSADAGIVHRVDQGITGYDHPRLIPTFAHACDTRPLLGLTPFARSGGMAEEPEPSRLAALGEAVERYSAVCVPRSRLRTARVSELAGTVHVEPQWLRPQDFDHSVRWVPGTRLRPDGPGEPAWIAASRAYLSDIDEGGRIATPTSTGLACHTDPWQALHSALLEVIERDAFMITWLTRAQSTPLHTSLSWTGRRGNQVRFDRAIEQYKLYRLPSPTGVPVVLALALGADAQPAAAVGAAAHPDLGQACRRALVEAYQTVHWAMHMLAEGLEPATHSDDIHDLDAHVAYYLDPAHLHAFDFLRTTPQIPVEVDLADARVGPVGEPECRALIGRLAAAGLDSFAVDVTAPDVRAAGAWVVRAVVPGLYPLLVGTGARPDHPRLPATEDVNPDPHPFP